MNRFKKYTDSNGFIRLKNISGVSKFLEMFLRMDNTIPGDDSKALYKRPGYTWSSKYGHLDYVAIEQASMFIERVKHLFPTGWILLSTINNASGRRSNEPMCIQSYNFVNVYQGYGGHGIRVYYTDVYGKTDNKIYSAHEIENIVFKVPTEKEMQSILSYMSLLKEKPEPTDKIMMILPEYLKDYNTYLADCEKYGFTPFEKRAINIIGMNTDDGQPITLTPSGTFGGRESDECVIVNKPRANEKK